MMVILNQREASPSGIAAEVGEPVPNIAYHMRILVKASCVELVATRQRRGAVEHFYRAVVRPGIEDDVWATFALTPRRQATTAVLQEVVEHIGEAVAQDGFDDPQMHVSWTTFQLDAEAWSAMAALLLKTCDEAMEIAGASARRRGSGTSRDERRTEMVLLHFERDTRSTNRA